MQRFRCYGMQRRRRGLQLCGRGVQLRQLREQARADLQRHLSNLCDVAADLQRPYWPDLSGARHADLPATGLFRDLLAAGLQSAAARSGEPLCPGDDLRAARMHPRSRNLQHYPSELHRRQRQHGVPRATRRLQQERRELHAAIRLPQQRQVQHRPESLHCRQRLRSRRRPVQQDRRRLQHEHGLPRSGYMQHQRGGLYRRQQLRPVQQPRQHGVQVEQLLHDHTWNL